MGGLRTGHSSTMGLRNPKWSNRAKNDHVGGIGQAELDITSVGVNIFFDVDINISTENISI